MNFRPMNIEYVTSTNCPLCGSAGGIRDNLHREHYYFGNCQIALPRDGVSLLECPNCSLLFKSAMPTLADLGRVMAASATEVWREKTGEHPALAMMRPLIGGARSFLDVGASNGDLLMQLKGKAERISALDIVEYPKCREVVNGEYIIGQLDEELTWSEEGYDVVTAFDIFEHFLSAKRAVNNTLSLARPGGKIIVETGDWRSVPDPGRWYYSNLFEHQIFWTQTTFEYLCEHFGCALKEYSLVNHKGRRAMGLPKRVVLSALVRLAPYAWFQRAMLSLLGRDPGHFGDPDLVDHAFVVLERLKWTPLVGQIN